jgi:hypothetical protein
VYKSFKHGLLIAGLLISCFLSKAQLSPGELSKAHAHLEGLTNCTKCHVLGEKETTAKCLDCHTEIKELQTREKGYHSSVEVKGGKCADCHSEHFGRDFSIINFEPEKFNHNLAGYLLEGKHSQIKCADCHNAGLIQNKISQKKGNTYLGLGTACLSCHDDVHQNTLPANCTSCHNQNTFRPATGFDHSKTKFKLTGKHQTVGCEKCHPVEERNGQRFQHFAGIESAGCTSCHTDVHNNRFGNDCRKCHNEFSFHEVKSLGEFNHEQTAFPLRGKHRVTDCKKCHTRSLTAPLKHNRCADCHNDFHEGQFLKNGILPDCAECHTVETFSPSFYTPEKHNLTSFPLEGSHLATPCFACHKTGNQWSFAIPGNQCTDCHKNIHKNYLDEKYIPGGECKTCHSAAAWNEVTFNHNSTEFALLGKHTQVTCRDCHFRQDSKNETVQQFTWENQTCVNCHRDVHFEQFVENGKNDCERCHTNNSWNAEKFDHNNARFKLDGKHKDLACDQCHKTNDDLIGNYIVYKFEDITCASCH